MNIFFLNRLNISVLKGRLKSGFLISANPLKILNRLVIIERLTDSMFGCCGKGCLRQVITL